MRLARKTALALGLLLVVLSACHAFRSNPSASALSSSADRVLVEKSAHRLTLLRAGVPLRTYQVALGRGGLANKRQAGDNRVPEGLYRITGHNPHSKFHRALRIGYPTPADLRDARSRGVSAGGDIMIHGIRNGLGWLGALQRTVDWTRGCIALTDPEIEEVYNAVPDGTFVEIRP